MLEQYSSVLLERAVSEFAKLPGIGRKTALRLVLYLLRQPVSESDSFSTAIAELRHGYTGGKLSFSFSDSMSRMGIK